MNDREQYRPDPASAAQLRRFWAAHLDALERHLDRTDRSTPTNGKARSRSMNDLAQYAPGPATGAQVRKDGEKWTLILVRELRHPQAKVWKALTDPLHLREWAPFDADGSLATVGATVKLTWVGTANVSETRVTRADPPRVLEFHDIRWELEPLAGGTRLTLWHSIDRRFIAWGAAGWHIAIDVLDRLLSGTPIARIAGRDGMRFDGWQRLVTEYAQQFGADPPNWAPKPAQTP